MMLGMVRIFLRTVMVHDAPSFFFEKITEIFVIEPSP